MPPVVKHHGRADDQMTLAMLDEDCEKAVIPSPKQAASLRQLAMLCTDELPMLAKHWLVDLDSATLRRLAGVDASDGDLRSVRQSRQGTPQSGITRRRD